MNELGAIVQAQAQAAARTSEATERLVSVQAQLAQQTAARDESKGLSGALDKVLRLPETWKPESREQEHATWQEFNFALRAYLVALDEGFRDDFKSLEGRYGTALKMDEMKEPTKKRGTVLYAVLTSLKQGRPQKIFKAVQPGNGYECYCLLAPQATPQLRARALAEHPSIWFQQDSHLD